MQPQPGRPPAVVGAALTVLTPTGITRTEAEDGSIYVLPGEAALDLTGELCCDWRDGDVW